MDSQDIVHEIMEASEYDSLIHTIVPTHSFLLSSMIDSLPEKCNRILELGCGTGLLTTMLAYAYPNAKIVAIDISKTMVQLAKSRKNLESVQFLIRDFRKSWPTGSFDAVVAALCLHHVSVEDRQKIVTRAAERLMPEGRFICGDIFRSETSWEEGIMTDYWKKAMIRNKAPERIVSGMLSQRQANVSLFSTIAEFREMLAQSGFSRTWVPFTSEFVGLVVGEMDSKTSSNAGT